MRRTGPSHALLITLVALGLVACESAAEPPPGQNPANPKPMDPKPGAPTAGTQAMAPAMPKAGSGSMKPGMIIPTIPPSSDEERFGALREQADAAAAYDAQAALAAYPVRFRDRVSYDPGTSVGLDTIQGSALALDDRELGKLGEQGFVVSTRREFPTFLRGYAEIYSEHLPLYVSADSILESVHSSYDQILLGVERAILIPELDTLLSGMHGRIAASDADASVKRDADFYLLIARGLLGGTVPQPVAGADKARADAIVA